MISILKDKLEDVQTSLENKNIQIKKLILKLRKDLEDNGYSAYFEEIDEIVNLIDKDDDYQEAKEKDDKHEVGKFDIWGQIEEIIEYVEDGDEVNVHTIMEYFNNQGGFEDEIFDALVENKQSNQKIITLPNIMMESDFEEISEKLLLKHNDLTIQ